jgi:quinol monooxygenase YgiN
MNIIHAGTVRVPPENLPALKPHLDAIIAATRAEEGCILYTFAEDVQEPGLLRVFEIWRDQAALDFHFATPHMAEWRAAGAKLGLGDRQLKTYEIASQR